MAGEQVSTLERVRREIERNALRARNGIKLVTGVSKPKTGQTPKDVVWTFGRAELWHYRNDAVRFSPPLLIIPSLVSRSNILDLAPGNSLIEALLNAGFDVYMLDWGTPDERDAANRFEDYVDLAIPTAIGQIRNRAKVREVNLLGYCFGGVLTLMHAAHNPTSPLRSLTVVSCPVDFSQLGSLVDVIGRTDLDVDKVLDENGNIPPQMMVQSFRSLAPMGDITNYVNLLDRMWSDEFVTAHQLMTGWAADHIPFPGAAARQTANMLIRDNALINGRLELGGDRVSLAAITVPFLAVLGSRDTIIPEASSAPVTELVGSVQNETLRMEGGHVGLVVGRSAHRKTIPKLIDFLQKRSEPLS